MLQIELNNINGWMQLYLMMFKYWRLKLFRELLNIWIYLSIQWSLGVLLWELMTAAEQPYVEVDPFEMETYLREGYRMSQPQNCPDEL